jgi:hypothetical protein
MAARERKYEIYKKQIYLFTAENNILSCEIFISPSLGICRPARQDYARPASI